MKIKRKSRVVLAVTLVVSAAGFAAHTALSAGRVANQPVVAFEPLPTAVGLPQGLLPAARRAATAAGVDPSMVAEAGVSATGSPYRSTLVGESQGATYVAFASAHAMTSFAPVTTALAGQPMIVREGTGGTPTELEQVGISIVVDNSVARVDVETVDGAITSVPLTAWPNAPYASASLSATVSGDFPKIVRAYSAAGGLIDEQDIDLTPPHS